MNRRNRVRLLLGVGWALSLACKNEADAPKAPPAATPLVEAPRPSASDSVVAVVPQPVASSPAEATCDAVATRSGSRRDLSRRENKIVGGKPSTAGEFPFSVALATSSGTQLRQYCGGSLIGKEWVLTAAHCQVAEGEKAIIGRRDLSKADGQVLTVKKVLNHAAYDADSSDNDIALLKLDTPVEVETVAPYQGTSALSGETSVVVGWGRLTEGGASPSILQEVSVPVVSNPTCSEGYAPDNVSITGNMLCAGLAQGGKDSCQGDSGGPLLVRVQGKFQQAGVVSFGIGCARPNRYGVYTRVANYAGWIDACMKKE